MRVQVGVSVRDAGRYLVQVQVGISGADTGGSIWCRY